MANVCGAAVAAGRVVPQAGSASSIDKVILANNPTINSEKEGGKKNPARSTAGPKGRERGR
ncbi:hypothetical protein GCM10028824_11950 [Hymenobacter segetis]